jgi:hypothetical protein
LKSARILLPAIAVLMLIVSLLPSASATLTLAEPIVDIDLAEDETARNKIDLNDYFSRDMSQISFSYVSSDNKVDVTIQEDGTVDFTAPSNWFGREEVIFIASDGEQEISDTIFVTVDAENDAPQVTTPLSDLVFNEDTVKSNGLNLYNHFQDIDSSLLFSSTSEHVIVHINLDGSVDFSAPDDWNGAEEVTFSASDGDFKVSDAMIVTVEPVNDPPTNNRVFTSVCLKSDYEGKILNLNDYFTDSDNELLTYQISGNKRIIAEVIPESGHMKLSVPEKWSGEEILTITASDSSGKSSSIQMVVIVTSQRDTSGYAFYLVGLVVALAVTGVRLQQAGRKRTIKSPVDLNSYRHYKGD